MRQYKPYFIWLCINDVALESSTIMTRHDSSGHTTVALSYISALESCSSGHMTIDLNYDSSGKYDSSMKCSSGHMDY